MHTRKPMSRTPYLGRQKSSIAPADRADGRPTLTASAATHVSSALAKTYTSEDLFGSGNELTIAHSGERYSLRITSLGKLIITK